MAFLMTMTIVGGGGGGGGADINEIVPHCYISCCYLSGDNVEDVFIDTAKKIYQNIQDGK